MTPDDMINDVLGLDQETLNEQEFYIGEVFEGKYPPEAAIWCNANNAYIEIISGHRYEIKEIPPAPVPTKEEQSKKRERAYKDEVDGITAHIQRLRDKEQTEEIVTEIAELIAERDAKVEEIKQRYPYPTDPIIE